MKHLCVWIVVGMVAVVAAAAQDGTFPMGAPVGGAAPAVPDSNTVEAILTTIIFILGVLVKVYSGWNKKNDAIANTLIRGIEVAANSATVKAAVKAIAAHEGQTTFLHRKVQKVVADDAAAAAPPTPTDDAPSMPLQGGATDTRHTTSS